MKGTKGTPAGHAKNHSVELNSGIRNERTVNASPVTPNHGGGLVVEESGNKRKLSESGEDRNTPKKTSKFEDRIPPSNLTPIGQQVNSLQLPA